MRSPITLVFIAISLGSLSACGDPAREPFNILVNSMDIVQTAVDRVEIVIRPSVAGQRFAIHPDMSHFGGTVTSRVTGAGEFAMFVEKAYIDGHARTGDMSTFLLDVPLLMNEQIEAPDPLAQVTFIRGAERIGDAERFLDWPLPDGGEAIFRVSCDRPDFARQCTNNDPFPVADSGTTMPDGGTGDGG